MEWHNVFQVDEYNGKRELSDLQEYVEKQLSAKLEKKEEKDEL